MGSSMGFLPCATGLQEGWPRASLLAIPWHRGKNSWKIPWSNQLALGTHWLTLGHPSSGSDYTLGHSKDALVPLPWGEFLLTVPQFSSQFYPYYIVRFKHSNYIMWVQTLRLHSVSPNPEDYILWVQTLKLHSVSPNPETTLCESKPWDYILWVQTLKLHSVSPNPETTFCESKHSNNIMWVQTLRLHYVSPNPETTFCDSKHSDYIMSVETLKLHSSSPNTENYILSPNTQTTLRESKHSDYILSAISPHVSLHKLLIFVGSVQYSTVQYSTVQYSPICRFSTV